MNNLTKLEYIAVLKMKLFEHNLIFHKLTVQPLIRHTLSTYDISVFLELISIQTVILTHENLYIEMHVWIDIVKYLLSYILHIFFYDIRRIEVCTMI